MAGERRLAPTFRLVFGTNYIERTESGIGPGLTVVVHGKELFKLERGTDEQLLLSTEVRDSGGKLLVKVSRNHIVHSAPGIAVNEERKSPRGLRHIVAKNPDETLLLEVDVRSENEVEVNGTFVADGVRIEASTSGLNIGGFVIAHSRMSDNGTAISIG